MHVCIRICLTSLNCDSFLSSFMEESYHYLRKKKLSSLVSLCSPSRTPIKYIVELFFLPFMSHNLYFFFFLSLHATFE